MKEKHKIKSDFSSVKHKKKKKNDKKKHDSSDESDSSDGNMQWVEASTSSSEKKMKKIFKNRFKEGKEMQSHKKKHRKKYDSSDDSDSSGKMDWVKASCDRNTKTKKKKKKRKKDKYSDSSSSSDSSDKMEWVEASCDRNTKSRKESSDDDNSKSEYHVSSYSNEKRESWMNEESFVPTLSKDEMYLSSRQKRIDSKKKQQEEEERIYRARELNSHLKRGGADLPESNVENLSLPSTSVGDGGYSWLKKAYYRIQEQAQSEGRSMEEIAVERWGSLSKLTSMIEEAEARMKSHPDFKKSKNEFYDKYNQDSRYNKSHFKKPSVTYESEKDFNSPFQFKKPTSDSRNHKKLNEFKSSRKSSFSSYSKSYERTKRDEDSDDSSERSKNVHKEDMESDNGNHIPRWKKQKYVHEKINHSKSHERTESDEDNDNSSDQSKKLHKGNMESDNRNHIPGWKKQKYGHEKISEAQKSVHPETSASTHPKEGNLKKKSEDEEIPVIYSYLDLTNLASDQLSAEIMGNTELAEKLKKQLEEARKIVEEKGFAKQPSKKVEEEVILTKVDDRGLARPIQSSQEKIESFKQKKVNKKFFDDGSRLSLKQMFEREKLTTADDHMEMFVKASAHSNEAAETENETGHISKKLLKKLSSTHEEERDIGKAIQQHQKLTASLEKCPYCSKKPFMIDKGEQVYLILPYYQTLTDGHCLIVPKRHVSSFLLLEENELSEVNDLKNKLRKFFRDDNKSVLFLETSMNYRYFPHAIIECIPVPKEDGDMAPFYFKKAIQESETEWSHNKKLVDLTKKGLQYSIPKGLPYFHIEFDPAVHAGYAHVIEDEKYFPKNFGKEVIGGMLDIDYNYLYKNKREDLGKKRTTAALFEEKWKKFKSTS